MIWYSIPDFHEGHFAILAMFSYDDDFADYDDGAKALEKC
jgi:hypothetical protein